MRWNVIALAFATILVLCVLTVVAGPATGQNSTQPSSDNNRIFFKCMSNNDFWMDANAAMNDSDDSYGTNVFGNGPIGEQHPLRPALDHDLHFDTTGQIHIQFKLERGGADPGGDVTVTLTAGNQTLVDATASGSGSDFTYDGEVPVEMINASDNLVFGWEYSFTGETSYTFYCAETYYVELPIVEDSDGDGIPDDQDEDSDNDGFTDDEEKAAGTDPYDPDDFPSGGGDDDDDDDNPLPGFESLLVIAAAPVAVILYRRRS